MDNELILFDRLNIIRDVIKTHGEQNFYLSFSGGKDSTVLHHLIDEALPNNKIPRVYINTGIEYVDVVKYVKELKQLDDRIEIINSHVNIPKMLERVGFPFKSKEHSKKLGMYQRNGETYAIKKYLTGKQDDGTNCSFVCPKTLQYQFEEGFDLKISDKCCEELKKKIVQKYEKETRKAISILGLRMSEGGQRGNHPGCIVFNKKTNAMKKFKPINPCTDEWCDWYIKQKNINLCKLYYPPYNFKRTGCKGCPFAIDLKDQLKTTERLLPAERKQCEYIWKPVYEEYRRINYRLEKNEQMTLL